MNAALGLVTWSAFVRYMAETGPFLPRSVRRAIRGEADARVRERWKAGRAEGVLDFTDLVERAERSLGGLDEEGSARS